MMIGLDREIQLSGKFAGGRRGRSNIDGCWVVRINDVGHEDLGGLFPTRASAVLHAEAAASIESCLPLHD